MKWNYLLIHMNPETNIRRLQNIITEIYAGGWIEFWDKEVRQDSTDHALYFKLVIAWNKRYMDAYILQTRVQL